MMTKAQKMNLAPLWLFLGYFCISTTGLTQAFAPESATPLSIGAMRMIAGGIFLALLGIYTKKTPNLTTIPFKNVFLASLALLMFQVFFFAGCKMIGVAIGTVVASGLVPIVSGITAFLLLKETLSKQWFCATFIMILGFIALGISASHGEYDVNPLGILFSMLAGTGYGLFVVFIKPALTNNGPLEIMTLVFIICGTLLFIPMLFYPIDWIFTSRGLLCVFNLGAITAALAFSLVLLGLRNSSANLAGGLSIIEPFFAAIWGITILSEHIEVLGYLGLSLILLSTIILVLPLKK